MNSKLNIQQLQDQFNFILNSLSKEEADKFLKGRRAKNTTEGISNERLGRITMDIVNQLYDLAEVSVEKRQEINDKADEFVSKLLRDLHPLTGDGHSLEDEAESVLELAEMNFLKGLGWKKVNQLFREMNLKLKPLPVGYSLEDMKNFASGVAFMYHGSGDNVSLNECIKNVLESLPAKEQTKPMVWPEQKDFDKLASDFIKSYGGPDEGFQPNKFGNFIYSAGPHSINIEVFFAEMAEFTADYLKQRMEATQ